MTGSGAGDSGVCLSNQRSGRTKVGLLDPACFQPLHVLSLLQSTRSLSTTFLTERAILHPWLRRDARVNLETLHPQAASLCPLPLGNQSSASCVPPSTGLASFISMDLITTHVLYTTEIQDPVAQKETIAWIRADFERNRYIHDPVREACMSDLRWR